MRAHQHSPPCHPHPSPPAGGAHNPSPAFCILYRLALTRLTRKELTGGLLQATPLPDAALLRGLGLLYLRYTCPPDDLWTWFAPALEDGGAVPLSPGINAASSATTLAAFARRLLSEPRYGGSQLPPVPVKLKQEWAVKLMLLDRDSEREAANARAADAAPALLVPGARVRARYSEDEKWYDAVVDGPDGECATGGGGGCAGGGGVCCGAGPGTGRGVATVRAGGAAPVEAGCAARPSRPPRATQSQAGRPRRRRSCVALPAAGCAACARFSGSPFSGECCAGVRRPCRTRTPRACIRLRTPPARFPARCLSSQSRRASLARRVRPPSREAAAARHPSRIAAVPQLREAAALAPPRPLCRAAPACACATG